LRRFEANRIDKIFHRDDVCLSFSLSLDGIKLTTY
jgi:hypothetical protein